MKRTKRLFIPVVLGVVLIAAVVGVASARPDARPLAQPWRVLTVPAHACTARSDNTDYQFMAGYVECQSGTCDIICPMEFPAAGEQAVGAINVKRFTMYVRDNDGDAGDNIVAYLRKTYPMGGAYQEMAQASSVESASVPQVVMDTSIENNPIYRSQAAYAWFRLETGTLRLYGSYIHYTW
jgi:hypothetical protein